MGRLNDAELLVVPEGEENPAENPARQPSVAVVRPVSIRCKNGHYLTALLRSAALRDDDGKYLGTSDRSGRRACAIEGHTDSKPYPPGATYTNWELSTDRANSARRMMQNSGIRADQITQVRGFADQRLRKPDAPLDPSNRRISLIVQYLDKKPEKEAPVKPEKGEEGTAKDGEGKPAVSKVEGGAKPTPTEAAPAPQPAAAPKK